MSFDVLTHVLTADVATSGTFNFNYPTGRSKGDYDSAFRHKAYANQTDFAAPADFTLTFNATNVTFTYLGTTTLAAGQSVRIQLDKLGLDDNTERVLDLTGMERMSAAPVFRISLGSPDVADVDGIAAAQAVAGAGNLTINGALASGGSVTFDVPRGVQIDSSNGGDTTQTATFTGTDEYGVAVTETLTFNGTMAVFGAKAFKTVTQVAISAALTGNATAGSSDVLGLPVRLSAVDRVLAEFQDNAEPIESLTDSSTGTASDTLAALVAPTNYAAHASGATAVTSDAATDLDTTAAGLATLENEVTAGFTVIRNALASLAAKVNALVGEDGTVVKSADAAATATTGDVRGTYDPVDAADGDKGFNLLVAVSDPKDKGVTQA